VGREVGLVGEKLKNCAFGESCPCTPEKISKCGYGGRIKD
jgi:hypothetical protein